MVRDGRERMTGVNPIARFLSWMLRPTSWRRPRIVPAFVDDPENPEDGAAGGVLAPLVPPLPTLTGAAAKRLDDEPE